jgi:ubiquinone/menaquinone biosynthesis C-methylase UbiE
MALTGTFDPVAFKESQVAEWQTAAPGWRKWYDVVEAEAAGQVVSRTLVEMAGLGPGDTVLDIGTGYGEPALTAARAVMPGGRVIATDIAADMLAFGRERAAQAGLENVEFLEADAETLSFDGSSFDAIISRQCLQFLPDVAGTLKRLHSFLKADGRLAAAVWGPLHTVQFALAIPVILHELELPPPPPGRPGIFALADTGMLAQLVAEAGFRDVETGTVTAIYETTSPADFTQWIRDVAPPIVNLLKGRPAQTQERVWRKVTGALAPLVTAQGRLRTENQAIWVAATK